MNLAFIIQEEKVTIFTEFLETIQQNYPHYRNISIELLQEIFDLLFQLFYVSWVQDSEITPQEVIEGLSQLSLSKNYSPMDIIILFDIFTSIIRLTLINHSNDRKELINSINILDKVFISLRTFFSKINPEDVVTHQQSDAVLLDTIEITVGQLAASVAHELNTPLANISLIARYVQMLLEKQPHLTNKDELISNFEELQIEVQFSKQVVQDLLQFSKKNLLA